MYNMLVKQMVEYDSIYGMVEKKRTIEGTEIRACEDP
jgi:hypothetical protein